MYLILGELVPALADPLFALLEARGEEVLHIPRLTSNVGLNWVFGRGHSSSGIRLADGRALHETQISAAIIQKFARTSRRGRRGLQVSVSTSHRACALP